MMHPEPEAILVPQRQSNHAYAFYATDDVYARALLAVALALHAAGSDPKYDRIVLHHGVSPGYVEALAAAGCLPVPVEPMAWLESAPIGYYRHCLTKLRIFQLLQYDRVIYFDADSLPLHSLDFLFAAGSGEPLLAPPVYWAPEPRFCSALLVIRPDLDSFRRCAAHFPDAAAQNLYDMDILNRVFAPDAGILPKSVFALDSEWTEQDGRYCLDEPDKRFRECALVHFSAKGKPWNDSPGTIRNLMPLAHPRFHELRERWWAHNAQALKLVTTIKPRMPS